MLESEVQFDRLRPHLPFILMTQLPCLLLASLLLDGGYALRICCVTVLAHWLAIGLFFSQPVSRTGNALAIVRWGFFLLLPLVISMERVIRVWILG